MTFRPDEDCNICITRSFIHFVPSSSTLFSTVWAFQSCFLVAYACIVATTNLVKAK
jgi:hypothetical protein